MQLTAAPPPEQIFMGTFILAFVGTALWPQPAAA